MELIVNNKSKYNELPKYGSKDIDDIINLFTSCQTDFANDELMLKESEDRQNDYLHDIEIPDKLTAKEITAIGREIRDNRRTRRIIKDEMLVLKPIVTFAQENNEILDKLRELSKEIAQQEIYLRTRTYRQKAQVEEEKVPDLKELTEEDKMIIVINKILNKWSNDYETNFEENSEGCVLSKSVPSYNFELRKYKYDFSAAKSTLHNFRELAESSIQLLYPNKVEIKQDISIMPVKEDNGNSNLSAKFDVYIGTDLKYTINGTIVYRQRGNNNGSQNRPRKRKK